METPFATAMRLTKHRLMIHTRLEQDPVDRAVFWWKSLSYGVY